MGRFIPHKSMVRIFLVEGDKVCRRGDLLDQQPMNRIDLRMSEYTACAEQQEKNYKIFHKRENN